MDNINVSPAYVLAGEAVFTVSNGTGSHYTYHTYRSKPSGSQRLGAWFIKVLTGPDRSTDFKYIGMLWWDREFGDHTREPVIKITKMSKFMSHHECVKVAQWALRAIWQAANKGYALPARYSILHEGKCGRCGRPLTTPESLDTGLGPDCAAELGVEWCERNRIDNPLPLDNLDIEEALDTLHPGHPSNYGDR